MMKLISMTLSLLSLTAGFALEGWQTDLAAARKQAVEQKKDLMIVYRGQEWKPGQPGRPESMMESPLFRDRVKDQFVLVEQTVKEGEEAPEKMVLLLADAQGRPFYGIGGSFNGSPLNWWVEDAKEGRKKKGEVLPAVKALEQATPGERKQAIEKVKKLLPGVCFNVPPASEWCKESPFKEESLEEKRGKMTRFLRGNITDPALIHWRKVFMVPLNWMSRQAKNTVLTEEGEREAWVGFEEMLDKVIAENPSAKSSRFADIAIRETFRGIPIMNRIGELKKTDPAAACRELLKLESLPEMSVENRQLWALMRASCLLKKGEMDQGLALIDQQVKEVPWTKNAENWSSLAALVRDNRSCIEELHQKELQGDRDAARERDELLGVKIDIACNFDVDMAE